MGKSNNVYLIQICDIIIHIPGGIQGICTWIGRKKYLGVIVVAFAPSLLNSNLIQICDQHRLVEQVARLGQRMACIAAEVGSELRAFGKHAAARFVVVMFDKSRLFVFVFAILFFVESEPDLFQVLVLVGVHHVFP